MTNVLIKLNAIESCASAQQRDYTDSFLKSERAWRQGRIHPPLLQVAGARAQVRGAVDDPTINADPELLRYSQTTAGGRGRADAIRASMQTNRWQGAAIDAVMTEDGLVTVDNTRPAVALELGMHDIPVRVHMPDEPLPPEMLTRPWNRFGQTAKTWREAARLRAAGQRPPLSPSGTPKPPTLKR